MKGKHFVAQVRRAGILSLMSSLVPATAVSASFGSTVQTLHAHFHAAATLSAPASATMTASDSRFSPFQVMVPIQFRVRTKSGGGGNITVQVTSDFSPAGGPSAAAGNLTYTCDSASLGTPCSGGQTATTGHQTAVLTLPAETCTGDGGGCSGHDPNTLNLTFFLTDDPGYGTGSYSAQLTFIISAM